MWIESPAIMHWSVVCLLATTVGMMSPQHLGCRGAHSMSHVQDYTICCQQALWSVYLKSFVHLFQLKCMQRDAGVYRNLPGRKASKPSRKTVFKFRVWVLKKTSVIKVSRRHEKETKFDRATVTGCHLNSASVKMSGCVKHKESSPQTWRKNRITKCTILYKIRSNRLSQLC